MPDEEQMSCSNFSKKIKSLRKELTQIRFDRESGQIEDARVDSRLYSVSVRLDELRTEVY